MAAVGTGGSKLCIVCKREFHPLNKRSMLCSDTCRRRRKTDWQIRWQKDNPKKHSQYTKLTRDRNPDLRRARRSVGAGRERAGAYGSKHESYSPHDLVAMLPDGCWICGGNNGVLGWDHVVPLIRGGADALTNIRPAHWSCNRTKRMQTPTEMGVI